MGCTTKSQPNRGGKRGLLRRLIQDSFAHAPEDQRADHSEYRQHGAYRNRELCFVRLDLEPLEQVVESTEKIDHGHQLHDRCPPWFSLRVIGERTVMREAANGYCDLRLEVFRIWISRNGVLSGGLQHRFDLVNDFRDQRRHHAMSMYESCFH